MTDAALAPLLVSEPTRPRRHHRALPGPRRWVATAVVFLVLFLLLPLAAVFVEAFRAGLGAYFAAITEPDAVAAIKLTLLVTAIAVPANSCSALPPPGPSPSSSSRAGVLNTLIDLPFSVSPVISGLIYVLLFGAQGYFGPVAAKPQHPDHLRAAGHRARHLFVTFPFVARELVPLMQEQGTQDEEAALSLGASGWKTFFKVTLPNIRWALLYGVVLCNARAMGEFGAVSVVSGHIRGKTNTMPLHVEILYNEYNFAAAFAVASLLALLALVTLVIKISLEWRYADQIAASRRH